MVDVYIGVVGEPNSVMQFEFDDFAEASKFCDTMAGHYKEERECLYVAIENGAYYDLDIIYSECGMPEQGEIDTEVFREIMAMQEV